MVHSDPTQDSQARAKALDLKALDALTGGAFTAATAGERAARIRAWMAGEPSPEQMAEVFKELSNRDKGAAKPLREKLDELRRARGQDALAADWAARAQALLDAARLNLADALAWQRDAAKAGAPLSREPLAGLKVLLAERVKTIEDLQHRAQVQREAAVLIIQRTEVLSTKPWRDARALWAGLRADVAHWREQADALVADPVWPSVDPRFPLQIESARQQLLAVWEAFEAALAQAVAAGMGMSVSELSAQVAGLDDASLNRIAEQAGIDDDARSLLAHSCYCESHRPLDRCSHATALHRWVAVVG
jgi:hypothetical protein